MLPYIIQFYFLVIYYMKDNWLKYFKKYRKLHPKKNFRALLKLYINEFKKKNKTKKKRRRKKNKTSKK